MKRIINGKKYDTETARKVAEWSNGLGVRDFNHMSEELYVKRTGEFFILGEGGPLTRYAEDCRGGGSGSGVQIIPITESEAREWSEKHMSVDEYEAIFGEVEE